MAAGTQMKSGLIAYAGPPIVNGLTDGLLSVFTDVSGATPNAGGRMFPQVASPMSQPEPTYRVNSGNYASSYFINRNHRKGEVFFDSFVDTGNFNIDILRTYIHWTTDQMLAIDVQSTSPYIWGFAIKIGATPIIDLSSPYNSGGLDTYANLPSSAGAYSPPTINTGWTFIIGIVYDPSNPPGRNYHTFDILILDYHTNDEIARIVSRSVGDPSSGYPYSENHNVYIDYWRCPYITVNIHP